MLTHTSSAVCDNHYIYDPFDTTLGVVQGSVISPLLYGVFVNDLITNLDKSDKGIKIEKFHIPCLLYCDDIILTTDNLDALKELLQICENHSMLWNYQFNPKKCNLITHNIKEPIISILSKVNHVNITELQKEYVNQIPFYYKNHSLNIITTAPLVLLKYCPKKQYVCGYDIKGIKDVGPLYICKTIEILLLNILSLLVDDNLHFNHWENLFKSSIDKMKS